MRRLAAALMFAWGTISGHAFAHGEPPRAAHGGLVQEAQELWLELSVKDRDVAVYVLDQTGKPVPASDVSGSATVLVGGKSYKVELLAADGNRVEGKLPVPVGQRLVATVSLMVRGKSASARFIAQ